MLGLSPAFSLGEFLVGLEANVVRLNPVVDLRRDLVFQGLSLHHLLVHEHFLDKDFRKALLKLVIRVPNRGSVLTVVDLRAARWGSVITWSLISMSHVKAEHELVTDLVQEGNVGPELGITRLELVSELNLDQLVELFGPLPSVGATVEEAHEHEHGYGALSLVERDAGCLLV